MKPRSLLTGLCLMAALISSSGCVSQQKLIQTDLPEDISPEELRHEIRSTNRTLLSLGGALLSGALGLVGGAKIGYEIGYRSDIKQGCEDCGLGGLVTGGLIGMTSGLVLGSVLGWNLGAKADRRAAIERIRRRRGTGSFGAGDLPNLFGCERPVELCEAQLWPSQRYDQGRPNPAALHEAGHAAAPTPAQPEPSKGEVHRRLRCRGFYAH